jgi:cytochrome c oxidase cbb3-type subunit 1
MSANEGATYNYKVVRQFAIMTVVWGTIGMAVGVLLAAQLIWPDLTYGVPWLSYGRLRPLHTNAVIFAFGGCALFATSYYVVQRTCQVRLFCDRLAAFTFWGWQAVIVAAVITLPLGITTSKEYAELEWPIDILIAVVWVSYAVVFFATIFKRKTAHIYVANWFFGGYILTVALLHIVNSAEIPATMWKSYSAYAGVQDAMVQWWYGHNAVGFFLTAGFLGMMYYFVPKQAERPIYSYRLSVGAFLGPDLHVHVGRSASSALHRPAGLDAIDRHGLLARAVGTFVGRHDQRHHDVVGRVAQSCATIRF